MTHAAESAKRNKRSDCELLLFEYAACVSLRTTQPFSMTSADSALIAGLLSIPDPHESSLFADAIASTRCLLLVHARRCVLRGKVKFGQDGQECHAHRLGVHGTNGDLAKCFRSVPDVRAPRLLNTMTQFKSQGWRNLANRPCHISGPTLLIVRHLRARMHLVLSRNFWRAVKIVNSPR